MVVEREPEWDEESRGLARALCDEQAASCFGCGEPVEESFSPLSDPDNREGTHVYEASAPYRCHACTARERAVSAFTESGGSTSRALRFPVSRVPRHG